MRRKVFILLALLAPLALFGQTYVSGTILNATWTSAGNPYIVIGDTWMLGQTTIEAGVEVKFNAFCEFKVEGILMVNGTEEDSVFFTDGASTWEWIYICSPDYCEVKYTVFDGAGDGDPMIRVSNGPAIFQHCTFRNSENFEYNLRSSNNYIPSFSLIVDCCDFYGNTVLDVPLYASQEIVIIENCRFFDNTCDGVIDLFGEYLSLYRCELYDNDCDYAVYSGVPRITNCVFYNTVSSQRPIFKVTGFDYIFSVQNSIIWECDSIANAPAEIDIRYCDLDVPFPGEGNISQDPLFIDPASGDFSLNLNSPCINTGNPGGFYYDYDSTRADMGITGGSGWAPLTLGIDFGELWYGQQETEIVRFFNLNPFEATLTNAYFTSPENFTCNILYGSGQLSPNEMAEIEVTFTSPGQFRETDLVMVSPQFIARDTASVHITGGAHEFTPVSGVWTTAGSPYYFYENLLVPDGDSLVIEPGVVIFMDVYTVLKIEGNLQAQGAEGDTIYFIGLDPNPGFCGLVFDNADGVNNLDYVNIRYVTGSPLTFGKGGGIYAENSTVYWNHGFVQSPNYENSTDCGGGMYAENCPLISIENVDFYVCMANSAGGGAYFKDCPMVIAANCNFTSCEVEDDGGEGGGIYIDNSVATIDSCWFDHSTVHYGHGIDMYISGSEVEVTRTLLTVSWGGGLDNAALALDNGSQVTFDHGDICFAIGDYAVEVLDLLSNLTISNSIIFDNNSFLVPATNQIRMIYSCSDFYWPGAGNIVGDPLITFDCHLTSNSPCIDTGDPNYPLDPDSTRTDMGAFYWEGGGPISGPVSGIWKPEHSPYNIGGDIYIPAGDTLIMEPGTIVEFVEIWNLDIYGVLLIEGEENDSVMIYGAQHVSFNVVEFNFLSTQGQSLLQYGFLDNITLYMGPTPTSINRCKITGDIITVAPGSSGNTLINSRLNGFIGGGENWTVRNNEIHHSVGGPLYAFAFAYPIKNAQGIFIENDINAYARATIEYPGTASAIGIDDCDGTFAFNTIYASAYAYQHGSSGIVNCSGECHHNSISAEDMGIYGFIGEVFNNTVVGPDNGIINASGLVKNCIVYDCNTGFSGSFEVQYSCVYDCNTPYSGVTVGPGNIREDPLLVNWYYLSPGSPCIDAGDPASPPDPDGTRADMGANYFDQGPAPISISLSPHNPPIQIPAGGGSFQYDVLIENTGSASLTFDAWIEAVLPDSSIYGPILLRENLALSPGSTISREDMTQFVPAGAPPGVYDYFAYTGTYPGYIFDSDSFPFEKLPGEPSPLHNQGWTLYGWENGTPASAFSTLPTEFKLHAAYPNPFNPTTTLSFALPEAGDVSLVIYDIQGREVARLVDGWRSAGEYQAVFDGSKLSSGIYFARLIAEGFSQTRKMLLIK